MSFLAKFKKKSGASVKGPPSVPDPPPADPGPPVSPQRHEPLPSPTHPVEISSIFTGLKLSAQVASNEADQSPYLQRNVPPEDEEEEQSSFSFLTGNSPPEGSPDAQAKSPFDFITEDSPVDETPSFSFLKRGSHDSEPQSHDPESQSHEQLPEIVSEPVVPPTESHDKESNSHDTKMESVNSPPKLLAPAVARQPAPSKKKKKKLKAMRPGAGVKEDTDDIDSLSLSSHTSSLDSSRTEDTPLSPTRQSHDHTQLVPLDNKVTTATEEFDNITTATEELVAIDEVVTTTDEAPVADEVTMTTEEPTLTNQKDSEEGDVMRELAGVDPNYSVELSVQDKLTTLLEGFESGLVDIRINVTGGKTREAVSEALSRARGQVEKRRLVAELRAQQVQVLATEDYELAEQIHQQLEESSLTQDHHIAESALTALSEWLLQCCETDKAEISFRGDMQTKISSVQEEQSLALTRLTKEHSSLMAKDKMKLQGMEDSLERERGHVALDKEHLERREQVLKDEVHRRAADFITEKQSLEEELTSVKEEIARLEEKLNTLRAQEGVIVEHISEQEGRITGVEEELAAEKSQLSGERERISVREQQLAAEQEKLVEEKHSMESRHSELRATQESVTELVTRAQSITEQCDQRIEGLRRSREEADELLTIKEQGRSLLTPSEKLSQLLKRVGDKSAEVDSLTSVVLSTQAELSSHRKTLTDLQAQGPPLQDAKKAAVTGRQFKDASRIASELKSLDAKMKEVKGHISTAETHLTALNKELTQHSEELETLKIEADDQEKEEDKAHLTALLASLDKLEEVKGRLESSSLKEVVGEWVCLYQLLTDNLAVKHSWSLEEHRHTGEDLVPIERTPGVGREEEEATPTEVATPTGIQEEIGALERAIEEACEQEDYDKAAELEEKLTSLKAPLETN